MQIIEGLCSSRSEQNAAQEVVPTAATLHLMVGLPGSGKTTLPRKLEVDHAALRLTVDEWHVRLFGMDVDDSRRQNRLTTHNVRHTAIEALLRETATRVLALGSDVILDFGFWTRRERDELRAKARDLNVGFSVHFVDASEQVLLERVRIRNDHLPSGTFHIPEASLTAWIRLFERPSPDELAKGADAPLPKADNDRVSCGRRCRNRSRSRAF